MRRKFTGMWYKEVGAGLGGTVLEHGVDYVFEPGSVETVVRRKATADIDDIIAFFAS